jgi:hypothetical protein
MGKHAPEEVRAILTKGIPMNIRKKVIETNAGSGEYTEELSKFFGKVDSYEATSEFAALQDRVKSLKNVTLYKKFFKPEKSGAADVIISNLENGEGISIGTIINSFNARKCLVYCLLAPGGHSTAELRYELGSDYIIRHYWIKIECRDLILIYNKERVMSFIQEFCPAVFAS